MENDLSLLPQLCDYIGVEPPSFRWGLGIFRRSAAKSSKPSRSVVIDEKAPP